MRAKVTPSREMQKRGFTTKPREHEPAASRPDAAFQVALANEALVDEEDLDAKSAASWLFVTSWVNPRPQSHAASATALPAAGPRLRAAAADGKDFPVGEILHRFSRPAGLASSAGDEVQFVGRDDLALGCQLRG